MLKIYGFGRGPYHFHTGNDPEADPGCGYGGLNRRNPSFLVGVAPFLIEMVLVLSEYDESEYVISNVLGNVLVELFEFQSSSHLSRE